MIGKGKPVELAADRLPESTHIAVGVYTRCALLACERDLGHRPYHLKVGEGSLPAGWNVDVPGSSSVAGFDGSAPFEVHEPGDLHRRAIALYDVASLRDDHNAIRRRDPQWPTRRLSYFNPPHLWQVITLSVSREGLGRLRVDSRKLDDVVSPASPLAPPGTTQPAHDVSAGRS